MAGLPGMMGGMLNGMDMGMGGIGMVGMGGIGGMGGMHSMGGTGLEEALGIVGDGSREGTSIGCRYEADGAMLVSTSAYPIKEEGEERPAKRQCTAANNLSNKNKEENNIDNKIINNSENIDFSSFNTNNHIEQVDIVPMDELINNNNNNPETNIDNLSPLERLTSSQYYVVLAQLETKLKAMRMMLLQSNFTLAEQIDMEISDELIRLSEEFIAIKSTFFLRPLDMDRLTEMEEALSNHLVPQHRNYEIELQHGLSKNKDMNLELPLHLSILSQANAGPIFKEKPIGHFVLRLMNGATISQIQCDPVHPEIVETSQRVKRNNSDLENQRMTFKENGNLTFTDLKFSSGTFPHPIRLKFRCSVTVTIGGKKITRTIESLPSKPFISMTNTGSQWKDAAGTWLKEDCFGEAFEVPIAWMWNYFQKHFLQATKQDSQDIRRPLLLRDFAYLLHVKFGQGLEKRFINQKEWQSIWDWIGTSIKKIRYQKHMLWMYEQGYLAGFVTRQEATEALQHEMPGTFLIRFSERVDGEYVISYVHLSGVRHYLVQTDDVSDKKRTFIDFLGQNKLLSIMMQLVSSPHGSGIAWQKHDKDKILEKHYKRATSKQNKPPAVSSANPYDYVLPNL